MNKPDTDRLRPIYIAVAALSAVIFLLLGLAVAGNRVQHENVVSDLIKNLFTGAGTVTLAILAYYFKERGAVKADERKSNFEIDKELRKEDQDIRISRSTLIAEFSSLADMASDELHFVREHTDPNFDKYITEPERRSPGTEVPLMGFFQDFEKLRQSASVLTVEEVGAIMAAYFVYMERRNYILRNSSLEQKGYLEAVKIGSVPFEFKDSLKTTYLASELGAIEQSARAAANTIKAAAIAHTARHARS